VAFAGYWGAASVAGYPLATDIQAPWATVHAVVPLAIPAAVGLAAVYRRGRGALADDDRPSVAAAVLVVLLVVGQVGVAATDLVYARPQAEDNDLVQYAQSSSTDLRPVLRDVERLARTNDGVDVVYYGTDLRSPNESDHDQPPAGAGWFDRLPIAWYTETFHQDFGDDADLRVTSTLSAREVADTGAPVVVALRSTEANTVSFDADGVAPSLEGYGRWEGQRYLYASAIAVFVDRDRLSDPAGTYGPTGGPGERAGTGPTTAPTGNRTAER
jgi:predicted membrane-bound mannosyltransferase